MAQSRTSLLFITLLLVIAGFLTYVAMSESPAPTKPVQMELPRDTFLPAE